MKGCINSKNRRQTIVSLTDYAKSLQEKYEAVSEQMNVLFYKGFSEKEQKQFERYLVRILDTLKENLPENKWFINGEAIHENKRKYY